MLQSCSPHSSSKTQAVLNESQKCVEANEKVVIFSSFVSYLDILQTAIQEDGLSVARIDGSKSHKQRASEIHRFSCEISVNVILCSIKACGVGVTLTAANNVFLTDLWWRPR